MSALPLAAPDAPASWLAAVSLSSPGRVPGATVPAAPGQIRVTLTGTLHERDVDPRSDADVVAASYLERGEACLADLRGAYAVVLFDGARNVALAAGDPMGAHPLFYAQFAGQVLFAVDPRVLVGQGVPGRLNGVALADLLCRRYPDPHETFFSAVRRVPPGFRVEITPGHVRVARYWDPLPDDRGADWVRHAELDEFSQALTRAVRRVTRAGRPGIFLSGGIDSVSVACAAADLARPGGGPIALSLAFPTVECDERARQRDAAAALGLEQHFLDFGQALGSRTLLDGSLQLSRRMPSPLLNAFSVPYLTLAQVGARRGVTTILTGNGGDEWWSVPATYSADLIRAGRLPTLVAFWRAWQRSEGGRWPALLRGLGWHSGLRPLAGELCSRLRPGSWDVRRSRRLLASDPPWIAPDPAVRLAQQERAGSTLGPARASRHGFRGVALKLGLDHPVALLEREESYGLGQLAGVTIASPLLDPDLVELACRTRPDRMSERHLKSIPRALLARRIPGAGIHQLSKVLASSFYRTTVTAGQQAALTALGGFRTLGDLGVVDRRAAEAFVQGADETSDPKSRAWDLLNLETWARTYAL